MEKDTTGDKNNARDDSGQSNPVANPAYNYNPNWNYYNSQPAYPVMYGGYYYNYPINPVPIQPQVGIPTASTSTNPPWKAANHVKTYSQAVKPIMRPEYVSIKPIELTPPKSKMIPSEQWPESLKKYVEKSFQECKTDDERKLVERELKTIIENACENGVLFTTLWYQSVTPLAKLKGPTSTAADNSQSTGNLTAKQKKKIEKMAKLKRKIDEIQIPVHNTSSSEDDTPQDEIAKRQERLKRFTKLKINDSPSPKKKPVVPQPSSDVIDWDEYTIVGTSTALEKRYLRLTSAPDPATVRPLPVLKKTLSHLKKKWKEENDYNFICDQFKSLRQDLTVQRIKNEFTVQVYEIHARIALEKLDLGEYNQCQTQLRQLYAYKLPGNYLEFLAYRLLYLIHTKNRSEINSFIGELSPEEKEYPAVKHALNVRSAIALSDYYALFQLYVTAPNMGGYVMDHFVPRERVNALRCMCKAYRPTIDVKYVQRILAFESENECKEFLNQNQVVLTDANLIDTKASYPSLLSTSQDLKKVDIKGQV